MPETAQMEIVNVEGREIKLRWKSPRFGEWLAWCYVPAQTQLHNEGAGFEARAATPDEAKEACLAKARNYLNQRSPASA